VPTTIIIVDPAALISKWKLPVGEVFPISKALPICLPYVCEF